MTTTITTNNRPRPLVTFAELPEDVRAWFDYLDDYSREDLRFVRFRGAWYDALDTMAATEDIAARGWHSIHGETFFSAVVFKFMEDRYGDAAVVIGHAVAD